jgi:GDP-mannose 4,6-dehydratase
MRVCLITGIGGFLGSHLAEYILDQGWKVFETVHRDSPNISPIRDKVSPLRCDIQDRARVEGILRETRPDVVFHLAARSLPSPSWEEPEATFQVNALGTINLLEAVRKAGLDSVVVVAGSSSEYATTPDQAPIREHHPLLPDSPYGASKAASSLLALLYHRAYQMRVIVARPFFVVIGPRKVGDVCSDFARQVVAVERGRQPSLQVGNLEAVRDFLDVGDAVRALWLLARKGEPGGVYNVCSGTGTKVRSVLEMFLTMASRPTWMSSPSASTAERSGVAGSCCGTLPRVGLVGAGWRADVCDRGAHRPLRPGPAMASRRAVFLDRDGVLNRAPVRAGRPGSPTSLEDVEVLPGVAEACARLRAAAFLLIVVTNQPEVARGRLSRDAVEAIHNYLRRQLPLDDIRVCYHDDDAGCECRKPKPGMLLAAAREWGIDLGRSFMVGDRWRDIEAGRRAGCRTVFIDYGYDEPRPDAMDFETDSLPSAAEWILRAAGLKR